MPAWYVHVIANLLIFVPLLTALNAMSFDLLLLIIAWGVLIDLDHLIYYFYKLHTLNFFTVLEYSKKDFKADRPHFYLFHTFDFFIIFGVVLYLENFDIVLSLLFLTGLVHWIMDSIRHYLHHRNFSWIKYYSVLYFLKK